jgi:hypothetical protein
MWSQNPTGNSPLPSLDQKLGNRVKLNNSVYLHAEPEAGKLYGTNNSVHI